MLYPYKIRYDYHNGVAVGNRSTASCTDIRDLTVFSAAPLRSSTVRSGAINRISQVRAGNVHVRVPVHMVVHLLPVAFVSSTREFNERAILTGCHARIIDGSPRAADARCLSLSVPSDLPNNGTFRKVSRLTDHT